MPDPTRNAEPARDVALDTRVPLEIVVELVEGRIRNRRRAARWRNLGLAVGLAGLAVTVSSFLFNTKLNSQEHEFDRELGEVNERLRQEALARVDDEFASVEDVVRFNSAESASVGTTRVVLRERERALFRLDVESSSVYRFEAAATAPEPENTVDTVLSLFRQGSDGVESVAFDDDSGEGLNARIERELQGSTTYFLEVSALFGGAGPVNLSIDRGGPGGQ